MVTAITDFTKVIDLRPADAIAYYNRGMAYGEQGDFDRAIADYTKMIDWNPNYAGAYYNRGLIYGKKSDFDRAIEDYTKTIGLNPDYADAYYNRWRCLAENRAILTVLSRIIPKP